MNLKKVTKFWALALLAVVPAISHADIDWVVGNVILLEDMRAHWPAQGILVNLGNKTYYGTGGAIPSVCTERFRIVENQDAVTADMQKSFMTILLAARLSGDKVRLLVNTDNVASGGFCTVRAVSIGEV